MTPPPSPESQLAFLSRVQRLFAEGDFTATYKFALLIALADIAVERGRDDGQAMEVPHSAIAATFIELFWQKTAPYSTGQPGTAAGVLAQNNGAQAAVVSAIVQFRQQHPAAPAQQAKDPAPEATDADLPTVSETLAEREAAITRLIGLVQAADADDRALPPCTSGPACRGGWPDLGAGPLSRRAPRACEARHCPSTRTSAKLR